MEHLDLLEMMVGFVEEYGPNHRRKCIEDFQEFTGLGQVYAAQYFHSALSFLETGDIPEKLTIQKAKYRPHKFQSQFVHDAKKLTMLGMTDKELAKFFEVTTITLARWKDQIPEFREAILEGGALADSDVANALYKRAIGYTHEETKIATHMGVITDVQTFDKHYPPDTTAALAWLKNKYPERWADETRIEVKGRSLASTLSDEELETHLKQAGYTPAVSHLAAKEI